MIASISIFCRKRTTGASSTSEATSVASAAGAVSSSVTSNSKSAEASASSASLGAGAGRLEQLRRACRARRSPIRATSWVANLMRSTASWSVGSAPPMKRRLPRLPSTSTWYCAASLASIDAARQALRVDRVEVEQRQRQRAWTACVPDRPATRRRRRSPTRRSWCASPCALRTRSSAVLAFELARVHEHARNAGERPSEVLSRPRVIHAAEAIRHVREVNRGESSSDSTRHCKPRDRHGEKPTNHAASSRRRLQPTATTVDGAVMTAGRESGRGERIRTSGLYVPNVALYQAKLHPDVGSRWPPQRRTAPVQRAFRTSARPIERTILAEPLAPPTAAAGAGAAAPCRPRRAPPRASRRARPVRRTIVDDLGQPRDLAVLDGVADQVALGRRAARHRDQQRQRGLALAQVVADVLAEFVGVALVVEQVVDELERRAERAAVVGAGLLDSASARRRAPRPGGRWPRTAWRSCSG